MKKSNNATKLNSVAQSAKDLYESKVGSVITQIEELMVTGEFRLRWDATPCNFETKRKYNGLNLLLIAFTQMLNPDAQSKYWLTMKQVNKLGYRVKKGAKSTPIVCWISKKYEVEETDEHGNKTTVTKSGRFYPKPYNVFNIDQTNADFKEEVAVTTPSFEENLQKLKRMMEITNVGFSEGGDRAFYSPLRHSIKMPRFNDFNGETQELKEQFYLTTLCHEIAHSTMEKLRPSHYHGFVNQTVFEPMSKALYGKEEVVAEITAALLCATLGIEKQVLPDHAAYVRGWLEAAKKESPLYFNTACKLAGQTHDYLMSRIDDDFSFDLDQNEDHAHS